MNSAPSAGGFRGRGAPAAGGPAGRSSASTPRSPQPGQQGRQQAQPALGPARGRRHLAAPAASVSRPAPRSLEKRAPSASSRSPWRTKASRVVASLRRPPTCTAGASPALGQGEVGQGAGRPCRCEDRRAVSRFSTVAKAHLAGIEGRRPTDGSTCVPLWTTAACTSGAALPAKASPVPVGPSGRHAKPRPLPPLRGRLPTSFRGRSWLRGRHPGFLGRGGARSSYRGEDCRCPRSSRQRVKSPAPRHAARLRGGPRASSGWWRGSHRQRRVTSQATRGEDPAGGRAGGRAAVGWSSRAPGSHSRSPSPSGAHRFEDFFDGRLYQWGR